MSFLRNTYCVNTTFTVYRPLSFFKRCINYNIKKNINQQLQRILLNKINTSRFRQKPSLYILPKSRKVYSYVFIFILSAMV